MDSSDLRIRLYQYVHQPACQATHLMLQHSGIPFEPINLYYPEPSHLVTLTAGAAYDAPVLEDLLSGEPVFNTEAEPYAVPKFISDLARFNLFPTKGVGSHTIMLQYIADVLAPLAEKICDCQHDKWLQSDMERGLMRRLHEERHGRGCLENWRRDLEPLTLDFYVKLRPFEHLLNEHGFVHSDAPTYADFALAGVVSTFLHPQSAPISTEQRALANWHAKMLRGEFPRAGAAKSDATSSARQKLEAILEDVSDMVAALAELKIRAGRRVLDIGTGTGNAAIHLGKQGINVLAADPDPEMLAIVTTRAQEEKVLTIETAAFSAEKLEVEDRSLDLIVSRYSSHYFQNAEQFVREVERTLKMYGYLLVIDRTALDDHPEAEAWLNEVERLRDPKHTRFVKPRQWRDWCTRAGLKTTRNEVTQLKMDNIDDYFDSADTPPENRKRVLELVARAPAAAREMYKISSEGGHIVWQWRKIVWLAGKI